jgi:hypothetical protein
MSVEYSIQVPDCSLTVRARRSDRPWGHAINVTMYDENSAVCGTIVYACHPEFRDFDDFQMLSTDALIDVVRQRLTCSLVSESRSAFGLGISLGQRLNAPDDAWAPDRKSAGL